MARSWGSQAGFDNGLTRSLGRLRDEKLFGADADEHAICASFFFAVKMEAQEIVTGENKQFARRSESLPTRFPCFRYTSAQQPTSLRRKLSPTLRWPIGGHRSFYSPNTRRLFVKQNVGPVPVTGPRLSFYHPQPEPGT
jgi:hypothetical protein